MGASFSGAGVAVHNPAPEPKPTRNFRDGRKDGGDNVDRGGVVRPSSSSSSSSSSSAYG